MLDSAVALRFCQLAQIVFSSLRDRSPPTPPSHHCMHLAHNVAYTPHIIHAVVLHHF